MLDRKTKRYIDSWITDKSRRNALLISGARQVGKTYLIRECLKEAGCEYLEINFIERPDLIPVFEQARTVDDLMVNLSATFDTNFVPGETIFFIDEVQEMKDLVTRVKFWVDDGRYRCIFSGSLLGIELRNLRSAPVGYMEELQMFPMDFEEFLIAIGTAQNVMDHIKECFNNRRAVDDFINDTILEHFRRYLIIGGMPAAVQTYVETGNIAEVRRVQQNIVAQYNRDFTKYEAEDRKLQIEAVYNQIPSQLLKQNKRFNYSDIQKGLKFERLENSFLWLTAAGAAIATYNTAEPRIALGQNTKSSLLKLYLSDVGLLTMQYGNAVTVKVLTGDDEKINLGGIYENVVAQELHAHGFKTYFYRKHNVGELDFVIEKDARVLPIEVKSGKDYYIHSALNNVMANPEYEIDEGIVFANCNITVEDRITYLPVYMISFIKDDTELPILKP